MSTAHDGLLRRQWRAGRWRQAMSDHHIKLQVPDHVINQKSKSPPSNTKEQRHLLRMVSLIDCLQLWTIAASELTQAHDVWFNHKHKILD